ncbi:ABC transporter permease [Sulfuriflexus mobilis]|uniref:ABC transporter permease n=1 Tax=Sulfuriflexus mobilis TaxID=1811807 RepID=UPI000F826199|nr:ABC transporter permease [Sulfuriflexus mobilis]
MMILHIAMRELRSLFLSPLAWAILAVLQFIMAWLFLVQIESFLQLQPRLAAIEGAPGITSIVAVPILDTAAFLLLLVTPLLSMRLISEERRSQTISLLFSAPLSMTEIVLGKYLGLMTFFAIMLGMFLLMPLSLLIGGSLDLGLLAAAMLGLGLLVASFAAVGLFMSSLTAQPLIAAMSSFGLLLLLWIIDWAGKAGQTDKVSGLFSYLSIREHFESFTRGAVNSVDLLYYLLLIGTALIMSIRQLDAHRLQH